MRGVTAGSDRMKAAASAASSRRESPSNEVSGVKMFDYRSARNLMTCARLNPAWLTMGATMLPRIK